MDSLREDGNREINHHGQIRSIDNQKLFQKTDNLMPTYESMTQRNEKDLVAARKTFYDNAQYRVDYLTIGMFAGILKQNFIFIFLYIISFTAKKGIPVIIITFSIGYWSYGLYNYFFPSF